MTLDTEVQVMRRRRGQGCVLVVCSALMALVGCRGPDEAPRAPKLDIDPAMFVRDWEDGPRRDAVVALVERKGREFARRLFVGEPMPTGMPEEEHDHVARQLLAAIDGGARLSRHDEPPAWWNGSPARDDSLEHDLPRVWVAEVQRGETLALLARWSGQDVERIREDNRGLLKKRKWLRPGDPLELTMSANQKLAFDKARERFQDDRLAAYFSKRYIERVVVYPVRRGDMIAKVAKAYGEVPLWLLEEFNQADFRSLQPGDTILIPVVAEMHGGRTKPPQLQVVDRDGRPLAEAARESLNDKLRPDLLGRARLAIDDSNVFERPEDAEVVAERALLPARVGHPTLPPSPVAAQVAPAAVAPAPKPPVDARVALREVIVKPGETVSHFAAWSGLTVEQIRAANPGLDPKRLGVGKRVMLPLSDLAYADFVLSRAGGGKAQRMASQAAAAASAHQPPPLPVAALGVKPPAPAAAPAPPPPPKSTVHVIAPGETASGLAVRYKVSLAAIARVNPGRNLDRLYVGDKLAVPVATPPR